MIYESNYNMNFYLFIIDLRLLYSDSDNNSRRYSITYNGDSMFRFLGMVNEMNLKTLTFDACYTKRKNTQYNQQYSTTNIGESIKGIRYTGYCNNCYNSSGINLYFLAAHRSHYNYGCWVFHISMVYEAKTME